MGDLDPVQSARDAITRLENATSTVESEIRRIRADADARIAELEASIVPQCQDLRQWRAALARAEGLADPERVEAPRFSATLAVDDSELLRVLRELGEPASVRQIRAALDIDPDVLSGKVTRLLADAVERGVLVRTGQRGGTRYSAA